MNSGYIRIIERSEYKDNTKNLFLQRLQQGGLTRDENSEDHFSVFFLPYDPITKKVLIGSHKKSGLNLPNGGHVDKGEMPPQTLAREFKEELGLDLNEYQVHGRSYLTITEIENPSKQFCKRHYDIWYFVKVDQDNFNFDPELAAIEFDHLEWVGSKEIKTLDTPSAVSEAILYLQENLF